MRFPTRFVATMTRADLLRSLPDAVGESFVDTGTTIEGASGWRIEVRNAPPLLIAALHLERIETEIQFPASWTSDRVENFMRRLSGHLLRGGG